MTREIPRLRLDQTVMLLIDIQERLAHNMFDSQRLVQRSVFAVRMAGIFGLPLIVTEQYVRGLGPTVQEIRQALPPGTQTIEKTRFSACTPDVLNALPSGRPTVLLCGIEAHVCVLQTALDLLESGRTVFLLSDAVSGGEPDQIGPAMTRMISEGARVTGCVSAAYELMGGASHPLFREALELVKSIR